MSAWEGPKECLVVYPCAFLQGWRPLSWCREEVLVLMFLGQPQVAGRVPGLQCPLLQSHHWEMEGVETFLQSEGMSLFGPGPATHFQKVTWRETVPCPRLKLPGRAFLGSSDLGIFGPSDGRLKLWDLSGSGLENLPTPVSCCYPGAQCGLGFMGGCHSDILG